MKTITMSILLLCLTGCAIYNKMPLVHPDEPVRFTGPSGEITWYPEDGIVQLPDRLIRLVDCSDEEEYCYSSEILTVVLPKDCGALSARQWQAGNRETNLISVEPHTNRLLVGSSDAPNIAFVVGPADGVTTIYYDQEARGLFARGGGWGELGYARLSRLIFDRIGEKPLLKCG